MIALVVPLSPTMNTLTEIEAAANALPTEQQEELLTFLAARLSRASGSADETNSTRTQQLERQFSELTVAWRAETKFTSSTTVMCTHPAYQRIVGMGESVLPFIFRDLQTEPDHWFWALKAITGCDPVLPSHRGHLNEMTADWLAWARSQGCLAP